MTCQLHAGRELKLGSEGSGFRFRGSGPSGTGRRVASAFIRFQRDGARRCQACHQINSNEFKPFPMISNEFKPLFKKIKMKGTCVRPPCDVWRSAFVKFRRDRVTSRKKWPEDAREFRRFPAVLKKICGAGVLGPGRQRLLTSFPTKARSGQIRSNPT